MATVIMARVTKKRPNLRLNKDIDELLDEEYPGEDQEAMLSKQRTKSKWARVESIVGSKKRIKALAKEIVKHFEEKQKILVRLQW